MPRNPGDRKRTSWSRGPVGRVTVRVGVRRVLLHAAGVIAVGGTLPSCQAVVADAVVRGTRSFVLSLLDPSSFLPPLNDSDTETPDG